MASESISLAGIGQLSSFQKSWKALIAMFDTEKPDESLVPQWIEHFKEARKWGEKFVANEPDSVEYMDMVKASVEDIHDSLIGLDSIENSQNQIALFNFWFGLHYVYVLQMQEWGVKSQIEFLEEQIIPAFNRALKLVPGYAAAQELLDAANENLAELKGEPVEKKSQLEDTAWTLINESNAYFEYSDAVGNTEYLEKIRRTTECIDKTQPFLNKISQDALPYEVYKLVEYGLASLYFHRATWKCLLGKKTNNKQMLKEALQDVDQASRFPEDCYQVAQMNFSQRRSLLQNTKIEINKALGGCFIATAAYGSSLAPEIDVLRSFREDILRPTHFGQWFIQFYEKFSPPMADWIARKPLAKVIVQKLFLTPIVKLASHQLQRNSRSLPKSM